jgi:hypothetical protein
MDIKADRYCMGMRAFSFGKFACVGLNDFLGSRLQIGFAAGFHLSINDLTHNGSQDAQQCCTLIYPCMLLQQEMKIYFSPYPLPSFTPPPCTSNFPAISPFSVL